MFNAINVYTYITSIYKLLCYIWKFILKIEVCLELPAKYPNNQNYSTLTPDTVLHF